MTHEEHYDILKILTEETWQARKKMLDYMKTVQIEENTPNVPIVEVVPQNPVETIVAPQEAPVVTNLDGTDKVPYPEYTGPVNWEPS